MKLILLRHEERYENPLFFTSLTEKGLNNAEKYIPTQIRKFSPDIIYSSPFRRTIQTIRPYCVKYGEKVHIDYSLYEYIHAEEFTEKTYKHHVTELEPDEYKDIIADYSPFIEPEDLVCPEIEEDIKERVFNFIDELKKRHSNDTVLLVSHMSTLNVCMNYYNDKTELEDEFKMGSVIVLTNV